ncbi:MAG TPA: prenyltransferase/squalene oxidase repeat-containing protein [Planctomycetota bacterium]
MTDTLPTSRTEIDRAVQRATAALMARRNPQGFWEGRLSSSPLATAVALCALGDETALDADAARRAFGYLAKTQNADGGWGDCDGGKSTLAATLLVLCADAVTTGRGDGETGRRGEPLPRPLPDAGRGEQHEEAGGTPALRTMAGETPAGQAGAAARTSADRVQVRTPAARLTEEQRRRAEARVRQWGGLEDGLRRVYGRDLTFQVPIRMAAASAGVLAWEKVDALPFELALAPRSWMGLLRLPVVSYALPALVCVGLSRHGKAPSWMPPLRWLRSLVADRALDVVLKMQPESGGYLEAVPITAFCLIGLKAAGHGEHAIAKNARKFLLATQRADGSWPVEVNLTVWNTTRAIEALAVSGQLHTAMTQAERDTTRDWLLAQQTKGVSVYSDAKPGGWGWNHLPGSVPDVDDTSGAMIALRHLGVPEDHAAIAEGTGWLLRLRNRDGGWPTFCRGWNKLPFDRSAPDLTAHALRAIGGTSRLDSLLHDAPRYLARSQHADGSFSPLWFGCEGSADELNHTYGTSHVLFALEGCKHYYPIAERARAWLLGAQNADGGFGGNVGTPSTVEDTGLALRALSSADAAPSPLTPLPRGGEGNRSASETLAIQRAAQWLIEHQRSDGSWDAAPVGFYFAVLWYSEELYPLCYGLAGLGARRQEGH